MSESTQQKQHIIVCPSCHSTYQIPEKLNGMDITIPCKQCGTPVPLNREAGPVPESDQPEVKEVPGNGTRSAVSSEEEAPGPAGQTPPTRDDPYLMLGKLALKYGLITKDQLVQALRLHEEARKKGEPILMGALLIREGMINQSQLDCLLAVQMLMEERQQDVRFGIIAVKNGFVTQEAVDQALAEQQKRFKDKKEIHLIGDILVESGLITEIQRDAILKSQKRIQGNTQKEDARPTEDACAEGPAVSREELDAIPLEIEISEDGLSVLLKPKKGVRIDQNVSLDMVKQLLEAKRVTFGITEDDLIRQYLETGIKDREPLTVARGRPPSPGKDAGINFHFETDPLKVGTIKQGGEIDFKDKGDIPQVKKGTLLAEKTPKMDGEPGVNVHGKPVPPPKPRDRKLRVSRGAVVSEDGLKVFADADGRPEISAHGKIYVFSEHKIPGDVGLKTGHIDFDGDIDVAGSIQNGFRVKGGSLCANEILKAEIDTTGDIAVTGGVIGATIRTRGNFRARYLHEARVEAFGDVVIEKEIIDTHVETSGACLITKGSILSSTVFAKKGIEAVNVGSDTSNPCTVVMGTEERVQNEVEKLKAGISAQEEKQEQIEQEIEKLRAEDQKINASIGEAAQEQDKAMVNLRKIKERMEQIRGEGDEAQIQKVSAVMQGLETEIAEHENQLEKYFARQEVCSEEIAGLEARIEESREKVQQIQGEINELTEWADSEKPVRTLKVTGQIFPYTVAKGRFSKLVLPQKHEKVLLKEIKLQEAEKGKEFRIKISRL
jgi:hypothetical protein